MPQYDVAVIGGGPAGLSAASSAAKAGARVLLIEREDSLGGILKQCIHDGFGLTRYHEKLSGPEYAFKEIEGLEGLEIKCLTSSFVTKIDKTDEGFRLHIVNAEGVSTEQSKTLILATGGDDGRPGAELHQPLRFDADQKSSHPRLWRYRSHHG